jgi:hypothetical protein
MKRLVVLLTITLSSLTATWAQEICNNGRDDDGDGFIDCYDRDCSVSTFCKDFYLGEPAKCEVKPPAFPQFTMALDFASPNETTNHLARMAIGDLNRDGKPEIVSMNKYTKRLFILNGTDGTIQQQATVTWEPQWEIAIANIDNDNCGEIFFFGYEDPPGDNNAGFFIYAYDCSLNFIWKTASRLRGDPINYGLADFDGNGKVELYVKDVVYDAHTGTRLIASDGSKNWNEINGGPVAVDMAGDDKLELVIGLAIYSVDLGDGTEDDGALTLVDDASDYYIRNEFNATSVADYNKDGFLDVLASGSTDDHRENTTVFFWDVKNDVVKTYIDAIPGNFTIYACPTQNGDYYKDGWKNGTGRLNIADLDGDGNLNISYVSGKFLYALDHNLQPLAWSPKVVNEETSGHTGCTLFDFNGDGKSEIVYRDERFLYIINGTNGTIYNQQNCISRTNREYPIVADVDADGSTELCVTCGFNDQDAIDNFCDLNYSRYSHIRVFKSASDPWVPARRVWNQHGYFNVNVNDDLTIPIKQQKHHLVFSNSSACSTGPVRPLNGFLNQAPFLNIDGCPTYKSPDLAFVDNSLVVNPPTCPSQNFTISFQVQNKGDIALSGNVPITFYNGNPSLAGAIKLNTVIVPLLTLGVNGIFPVTNVTVNGPGGPFTLFIVLNDNGSTVPTPINLPNTNFLECDYSNNILSSPVTPLPVPITALKVKDNIKCSASIISDNGAVRAFIPGPGGTENTTDYNFYWSIGSTAKPVPADYPGAAVNALANGNYTVMAVHKTANCSSSSATVAVPLATQSITATITLQSAFTNCKVPNGSLKVVVNDTDGDGVGDPVNNYTYTWYVGTGAITDPVVSVSDTPTGLSALSYAVLVRDKATGCLTIKPFTVPDLTTKPIVTATPTNATCVSATSGSATANVGGVTAGFKFNWYRGASVKPTPDFVGVTYTGLTAGQYTVVAENNASKCESAPFTTTVGASAPVTVAASVVSNQSSCSSNNPNGSVSANVPGFTTGYTFEWFKGASTAPVNLISSVSTATGLAAGVYTVRATNTATSCSDTEQVTVTSATVTPILTLASIGAVTNCTTPNGSVTVNVSYDLPSDYTFFWYNGPVVKQNPDYDPAVTTNVLSGRSPGTYTVKAVHKTKFCATAPISATVSENTPAINIVQDVNVLDYPTDCLINNGVMKVDVSAAGNTSGFIIEWFKDGSATAFATASGVTTSTQSGLGRAVYSIRATNLDNGCSVSRDFDLPLEFSQKLELVSTADATTCSPQNEGNVIIKLLPATIPGPPPIIYSVNDYDLKIYAGKVAQGVPQQTLAGSTGALNADLTANYTFASLIPGFYTVVAVGADQCPSNPIVVEIKLDVTYPIVTGTQLAANTNCSGATANGRIELDVDGLASEADYSYAWFEGETTSDPVLGAGTSGTTSGSGEIAQNLPEHMYTVEVTNIATQCSSVHLYQILNNPPVITIPTAGLTLTPITMCNNLTGGSAAVLDIEENGSSANLADYTFSWFDNNQNILPNAGAPNTTSTMNGLTAGSYFVSVTKTGGLTGVNCPSSLIGFTIEDETINTVAVNLNGFTRPTRCLQPANITGELIALASGTSATGYTYNWYAGTTASGPVVSPSANNSGITIPPGQPDITFTVDVINNSNQCHVQETYVLPLDVVPVLLTASAAPVTSCVSPDGVAFATVTSESSNAYSYNWDLGNAFTPPADLSGKQISNLATGDYTVVAIDLADAFCQSAPVTVTVLDGRVFPFPTAMQVAPLTICDPARPDGVARVSVGGDVVSYRFDWFNGAPPTGASLFTGSEFGNLTASTFSITATHLITGCSGTTQVTISENKVAIPVPFVTVLSDVTSCLADNGALSASINGNTGDFKFHWFNVNPGVPADTSSANYIGEIYANLSAGTYYVTATSRLTGCISAPANGPIVNAPVYPEFDFLVDNPTCDLYKQTDIGLPDAKGEPTGSITLHMLNQMEIQSITWSSGSTALGTGPILANIVAGTYDVTVVSSFGCSTSKTVDVVPDINPFNGISRNGDEKNPIFQINCIENFPGNLVKIFNRAGTLVYEAEGYDNVEKYFDGKSNKGITVMGNNLPDGTYFYIIDKRDGSKPTAGYLEVVN